MTAFDTEHFALRGLLASDRDLILRWRNSDSVREHMFNPDPIPAVIHARWFSRALTEDPLRYRVLTHLGRDLGFVSFARDRDASDTWTWGLYIGEPDAPRGSGSALGTLALKHGFLDLMADQIVSEAMAANLRAIRLYARLGFRQTGTRIINRGSSDVPEEVIIFSRSRAAWTAEAPDADGYASTDA